MNIDIICPLYNAKDYIIKLNESILNQKNVVINKINYILTKSSDNTEELMKENNIDYAIIEPKDFSHSLTREKFAMNSNADILVFITQDIIIKREDWLYNLTKDIQENKVEATFSRQIAKDNSIEKYIREKNYPKESYIVEKKDIEKIGFKAFFFSDASSAVKTEVFKKLNGYDGKNFTTNEDMYIASKVILNGYKIKYCADSVVIHSHEFSFKQIYKRYYNVGLFLKQNEDINKYSANKSGKDLALYVLKRCFQEFNIKELAKYPFNMFARYKGMKDGKKL